MHQGFVPFKSFSLKYAPQIQVFQEERRNGYHTNMSLDDGTFANHQQDRHEVTKKICKRPKEKNPKTGNNLQNRAERNLKVIQQNLALFMTEIYFTRKEGKIPEESPYRSLDLIFNSDEFQAILKYHQRNSNLQELDLKKSKGQEIVNLEE